jgi:hypothetical protein
MEDEDDDAEIMMADYRTDFSDDVQSTVTCAQTQTSSLMPRHWHVHNTRESGIGSPVFPFFFAGKRGGNPGRFPFPDLAGKQGTPVSRFGREPGT